MPRGGSWPLPARARRTWNRVCRPASWPTCNQFRRPSTTLRLRAIEIRLTEIAQGLAPDRAVRVDAILDGPIDELFKLVIDHDRAAKFSFVREYKVLSQSDSDAYVYQRVKDSNLADRDFTIHITLIRPTEANKNSWGFAWTQANSKGPAPRPGVVRATMVQGSYVLTPLKDGRTQLSYRLIFDPNTWIPDFVLRRAVRGAARQSPGLRWPPEFRNRPRPSGRCVAAGWRSA